MDWPLVVDFIAQHDPRFLDAVQGVPESEIAALAAACDVTLPKTYIGFLRLMGIDNNGLAPFGARQDVSFAMIVERIDEEDAEEGGPTVRRYFPIAVETDNSLEVLFDHWLDLQRSNGDDAPIVMLEQGVPIAWQQPVEIGETFGERILARAFTHFALRQHPHSDLLAVGGAMKIGEGRAALDNALVILQSAGFAFALPPLGGVACLHGGSLDILARVNEIHELLTLRLGGDTVVAVKEVADQLLTNLAGAHRPAGPRNLE